MLNMSIYHRTYTRKPIAIDVQIKFKGKKLGHTFTRNINPFGAFISLVKHGLVTNNFVEMHFTDKDIDHNCVVQKGIVIHHSEEGVGILFAYDNEEFYAMLDKKIMELTAPQKQNLSKASIH
jgi:hypothetical protein